MRIYYARCMAIYNTEEERQDVADLEQLGFEVVNPNSTKYGGSRDMSYYLTIVRGCDALAFKRLPNGSITSGVWKEVMEARRCGKVVIELPYLHNAKVLSHEDTRKYIYGK